MVKMLLKFIAIKILQQPDQMRKKARWNVVHERKFIAVKMKARVG